MWQSSQFSGGFLAMISQHTVLFPSFERTETTAEVELQVGRLTDARGEAEFIWLNMSYQSLR